MNLYYIILVFSTSQNVMKNLYTLNGVNNSRG